MNVLSNDEFAERVMAMARPLDKFEPTATYDPDGDCIEFFTKPDSFYAKRVDDLVTVYYSDDTDEIIGSLIKGVSGFCKKITEVMPGFVIEIRDGRTRLVHLFRARLWTSKWGRTDPVTRIYEMLIKTAEESEVDVEAGACST